MYDHLQSCKKEVPLLARFASKEKSPVEPLLAKNALFCERLGHSGDKFPLAVARRDDDGLLCVVSFNWFSATRDKKYHRYDRSMVYRGESLKAEIKTIFSSLEQRQL
ncbi:phospholipase D-like domain-containing protein [Citrobacter portucalensis]|uniref:hypothetical protein n=1 Tax=Citrobacter portucalensis TaxID=1639133 RepID=UPI00292A42CB|nr:hypothetical protein [Citrobacter portucalensis]